MNQLSFHHITEVLDMFGDNSCCYTQDSHIGYRDLSASRWNAHEAACVGATKGTANRDRVSFSDQVLSGEMGIGEGGEELREEVFVGLETLDSPGDIVKHEGRGTQLIDECRVLLI